MRNDQAYTFANTDGLAEMPRYCFLRTLPKGCTGEFPISLSQSNA